jgi:hypothetical protein
MHQSHNPSGDSPHGYFFSTRVSHTEDNSWAYASL